MIVYNSESVAEWVCYYKVLLDWQYFVRITLVSAVKMCNRLAGPAIQILLRVLGLAWTSKFLRKLALCLSVLWCSELSWKFGIIVLKDHWKILENFQGQSVGTLQEWKGVLTWNEMDLIGCWTHSVTLSYDFDLGLPRWNFEKGISQEWDGWMTRNERDLSREVVGPITSLWSLTSHMT